MRRSKNLALKIDILAAEISTCRSHEPTLAISLPANKIEEFRRKIGSHRGSNDFGSSCCTWNPDSADRARLFKFPSHHMRHTAPIRTGKNAARGGGRKGGGGNAMKRRRGQMMLHWRRCHRWELQFAMVCRTGSKKQFQKTTLYPQCRLI